jgi:hypothetical protein
MAKSNKRDEWVKRVERWKRSGLSAMAFAEREGFNGFTLRWWACQLKREPIIEDLRPKFVEVVMPAAPAPVIAESVSIEVVVRAGVRVLVPNNFDDNTLRRVLRVVEVG